MEITSRIIGAYRGYQIAELREKTTQEDYDNEMFDWVKQLMTAGEERIKYKIIATPIILRTIDETKKYIDKILNNTVEIYDDGLDHVDTSPAKYKLLSYCTNQIANCQNCELFNKDRNTDCSNRKLIS